MITSYFHKAYDELKHLMDFFLPEFAEDHSKKYQELFRNQQLERLLSNAPSIVFVINLQTLTYEYFSKNVKSILGYNSETYMEQGLGYAMSTMDPDHVIIHNKYIYEEILQHTTKYISDGVKDLRFCTTFKVRKADGTYIWAMQQFTIIETDAAGIPWLSLFFMLDISEMKKDQSPELFISKKDSEGIYQPIFAGSYHGIDCSTKLTKRELEILDFISKGYSSKMIGDKLNVSENTVKTHRKNMLKKTNAKNSTELFRSELVGKIFKTKEGIEL